jgi:hypothetical protein
VFCKLLKNIFYIIFSQTYSLLILSYTEFCNTDFGRPDNSSILHNDNMSNKVTFKNTSIKDTSFKDDLFTMLCLTTLRLTTYLVKPHSREFLQITFIYLKFKIIPLSSKNLIKSVFF